jgi:hypothetical protein
MCVCVYVCMCVCVYVCMCVCMYVCMMCILWFCWFVILLVTVPDVKSLQATNHTGLSLRLCKDVTSFPMLYG